MIELPGYKLIRELGRGGMARVYLALHEGLDRFVAIKLMYSNLSTDPAFSDRFLREARIVARMSHPNIITIFDVNVHKGYHYIAMEYLPGESLGDKIKAGLDPSKALAYLKQMSKGLQYAHDKGFIHRDIKPENILFREDGSPVITDFGVARAEMSDTRMTEVGTIIGTPHYMSPEQAQGIEIKANSDIYSLGIVFHEMLTGVVPYRADSIVAIMYKHVNDPIPVLNEKLSIFQPLLDKLLAKNAADRFQSGTEIIKAIERIELRVKPELATVIMPAKDLSRDAVELQPTLLAVPRKFDFSDPLIKKYALALASFVLLVGGTAILMVSLSGDEPSSTEIATAKQNKQLAYQQRVEEARAQQAEAERLRQERLAREAVEREKAERDRVSAAEAARLREQEAIAQRKEQERLAAEQAKQESQRQALVREQAERERKAAEKARLELAMRQKASQQQERQQTIQRLTASAEAAYKQNNLKEAYSVYRQILDIDSNNKAAKKGLDRVAGRYLSLAVSRAKKANFDSAESYVDSAVKIAPQHPQLASTRQKITELKNKRRTDSAKSTKQEGEAAKARQGASDKVAPTRAFGGF